MNEVLQRSQYNHETLLYLLDELIPWHGSHDFSTLEVNRYVYMYMYILCSVFSSITSVA